MLFDSSQIEYEKQQSTNIVDAAVYSGLQVQAKSLNLIAYTNRAMIANQVAVGQLVSTSSWLDYLSQSTQIFATAANVIPYIGQFISTGLRYASTIADRLQTLLPPVISGTNLAIQTLSASQIPVKIFTLTDTRNLISRIIETNDNRYSLTNFGQSSLLTNLARWSLFTEYHNSDQDMRRQAQVITQSTDQWTTNRNHEFTLINLWILEISFNKQGESRLVEQRDARNNVTWNWEARDAASIHVTQPNWRGRRRTVEIPLVGASHTTGTASNPERWFSQNRRSESIARVRRQNLRTSYTGLQNYLDVREKDISTPLVLPLVLEIGLTNDLTRTYDQIIQENERLPVNYSLTSLAKGEVFFQRPYDRQDGRTEYASLFTPFWTAHLVDHSYERLLAIGARQINVQ